MKSETMNSDDDSDAIIEFLLTIGCCRICVLRFLKPNIDDFLNVDDSWKKVSFPEAIFLCFRKFFSQVFMKFFPERCSRKRFTTDR